MTPAATPVLVLALALLASIIPQLESWNGSPESERQCEMRQVVVCVRWAV